MSFFRAMPGYAVLGLQPDDSYCLYKTITNYGHMFIIDFKTFYVHKASQAILMKKGVLQALQIVKY